MAIPYCYVKGKEITFGFSWKLQSFFAPPGWELEATHFLLHYVHTVATQLQTQYTK